MNPFTCIVVGGGHAGIHAVKAIRKEFQGELGKRLRLILIDQKPYHLRKVLLFKIAANDEEITIPFKDLFPEGVDFIQATVTEVDSSQRRLIYQDSTGEQHQLNYDILVVAVGSVVRQPEPTQGGIPLLDLHTAMKIREKWRANLMKAKTQTDLLQRKQLTTIAIAGAGISGIETSAELASAVREDAKRIGLNPANIKIYLFNAHHRLFPEGPAKVSKKLEQQLVSMGVNIFHNSKVLQEKNGFLSLDNGKTISVGLCIWTLGLMPNPLLRQLGLPLTPKGEVVVDHSYRVKGATGIYSIGDCAQIIDPKTGLPDGKTCKEASAQALRLGKIIAADLKGKPAPIHKEYIDFFCFGLGPKQGIVWTRLLGQDIILTGKLGWQIRKFTWDLASLVK